MFPYDWLDTSYLRGDRSPTQHHAATASEVWAQGHADYPALHRLNHADKVETAENVKVSYHCVACLRECTTTLTREEIVVLASGARPGPGLGSDVVWEEEPTWSDGTGGGFSPRVLCVCGYDVPSFVLSVEECRETLVRFPHYAEGAAARLLQARAMIAAQVPRFRGGVARATKALEPLLSWLSSKTGPRETAPSGPHDEGLEGLFPFPPVSPFVGEVAPPSVTTPGDRVRAYEEGAAKQVRTFAREVDQLVKEVAPGASFFLDEKLAPDMRKVLASVWQAGSGEGYSRGLDAAWRDAAGSLQDHLSSQGIIDRTPIVRTWKEMLAALVPLAKPKAEDAPSAEEEAPAKEASPSARTHR